MVSKEKEVEVRRQYSLIELQGHAAFGRDAPFNSRLVSVSSVAGIAVIP